MSAQRWHYDNHVPAIRSVRSRLSGGVASSLEEADADHAIVGDHEEAIAERLEQSGRFRILRRLMPRQVIPRSGSPFPRLAVLFDTETTGLSHTTDEVIEIGAVAFTYDDAGNVVGAFNGLRQPSIPIQPEITRLTGITNAMVAGESIDIPALNALIEPADLIIAHNAGFDRPFCEKLTSCFVPKP